MLLLLSASAAAIPLVLAEDGLESGGVFELAVVLCSA